MSASTNRELTRVSFFFKDVIVDTVVVVDVIVVNNVDDNVQDVPVYLNVDFGVKDVTVIDDVREAINVKNIVENVITTDLNVMYVNVNVEVIA